MLPDKGLQRAALRVSNLGLCHHEETSLVHHPAAKSAAADLLIR
jgi:hypothetical protein